MPGSFCCRSGRCGGTCPFTGSRSRSQLPPPTLRSLALFGQMIFGALCGLEYIAILAGESKHAARSIGQSVWISSPVICAMFILGTSAVAAFSQHDHIDFIAPIPQTVRLALGHSGIGSVFAVTAILLLQMRLLAAASYLFTGVTRLPMTVGWDNLVPGLVYSPAPAVANPGELHPMHVGACLFVAGAGKLWGARAGGLPTALQCQPRALRTCLSGDVCHPSSLEQALFAQLCPGGLSGHH